MSSGLPGVPDEARLLLRLLDRPDPPLLLVVGSGISLGATGDQHSTWRGLLNHAVDYLESQGTWSKDDAFAERHLINKSFDVDFDLDEVLRRADSITKALGGRTGPLYAKWLSVSVGSLRAKPGRTAALEAIRDPVDAGALVLTTNYDGLLCEALRLPPITWKEPERLLEVITRKRKGIIHIHGHWERPTSVVFGKRSYDDIIQADVLQRVFTSIWLQWHWLYVGAGAGLEDPNLGELLKWGSQHFSRSSPTDFFLGRQDIVDNLGARADKLANVVPIAYREHADLPPLLRTLTPQARSAPFQKLESTSARFRQPGESAFTNPLPT